MSSTSYDANHMSEWTELYVAELVQRALSDLNFDEPTEIQRLVLPSAIRDKLDILGAAETVYNTILNDNTLA